MLQQLSQIGRFAQNGRCGYVLKPSTCRPSHVSNAEKWRKAQAEKEAKLAKAALGGTLANEKEQDPLEVDDVLDYEEGRGSSIIKIKLLGANRLPKSDKDTSNVYLYLKVIGHRQVNMIHRSSQLPRACTVPV